MMALLMALPFFCNWLVECLELACTSGALIFTFGSVGGAASLCGILSSQGELYS